MLSLAQMAILNTDARSATNATALAAWIAAFDDQAIAAWYNQTPTGDFWVWRTRVGKAEMTQGTSVDGTTFSWVGAGFITRAQGERDAWRELFDAGDGCNPSLANVRQAFQDIFSGATAPAPANRLHLTTMSRRKCSRIEQLLATGVGSVASPGTLTFEGLLDYLDVARALRNVGV